MVPPYVFVKIRFLGHIENFGKRKNGKLYGKSKIWTEKLKILNKFEKNPKGGLMIFETKVSEVLGKIIRGILMKILNFDQFRGRTSQSALR